MFDFMLTADAPVRIICDRAYDSNMLDDDLAQKDTEMIVPHPARAAPEERHAGRPMRRYERHWTAERTISWFQNVRSQCIHYEKSTMLCQAFLHFG